MKRRSIEFQKAKAYAEDTKATNSSTLVYELDQIAEDRELENLEMIYELEYKLQRMAGVVSQSLDEFRDVELTPVDQENIDRTRELIEASLKRQLHRQMDKLNSNQSRKSELDSELKEAYRSMKEQKVKILRLKQQIRQNQKHIAWAQKRERDVQTKRLQHEEGLRDRAAIMGAYRVSQDKVSRLVSEMALFETNIKSKQAQIQKFELEEEQYQRNAANVLQYARLEQHKLRLAQQYQQTGEFVQHMSKEKIEELIDVRENTVKIQEQLKIVVAEIYQQKAFLRMGEQEKKHDRGNSTEREGTEDELEEINRGRITEDYEQKSLPPVDNNWMRMKQSLNKLMDAKQSNGLTTYQNQYMSIGRQRLRTQHIYELEEESSNEGTPKRISHKNIKTKSRKLRTEVSEDRSSRRFTHQSTNLKFDPAKEKQRKQPRKSTRITSMLPIVPTSNRRFDSSKKIQEQPESKPSSSLSKREPRDNEVELVSVGSSENDPDAEYVEIELSKKDLERLAQRRNRYR